jgi:hypothetical protein
VQKNVPNSKCPSWHSSSHRGRSSSSHSPSHWGATSPTWTPSTAPTSRLHRRSLRPHAFNFVRVSEKIAIRSFKEGEIFLFRVVWTSQIGSKCQPTWIIMLKQTKWFVWIHERTIIITSNMHWDRNTGSGIPRFHVQCLASQKGYTLWWSEWRCMQPLQPQHSRSGLVSDKALGFDSCFISYSTTPLML